MPADAGLHRCALSGVCLRNSSILNSHLLCCVFLGLQKNNSNKTNKQKSPKQLWPWNPFLFHVNSCFRNIALEGKPFFKSQCDFFLLELNTKTWLSLRWKGGQQSFFGTFEGTVTFTTYTHPSSRFVLVYIMEATQERNQMVLVQTLIVPFLIEGT